MRLRKKCPSPRGNAELGRDLNPKNGISRRFRMIKFVALLWAPFNGYLHLIHCFWIFSWKKVRHHIGDWLSFLASPPFELPQQVGGPSK